MAGLYVHIPFCKKACFYCDFHFDVSFKHKDAIVSGLINEIKLRKEFISSNEAIESIYFGGGTPSVLSIAELEQIFETIHVSFDVATEVEVTFECNPDDLSLDFLKELKSVGVNRLSIGLQSFNDEILTWMNRSHNSQQSVQCVLDAAEVGFDKITIDLIYGIPQLSDTEWRETVLRALQLPVNHLSAYSLTLEENTPYEKLVKQQKYEKPNNDLASDHYSSLIEIINQQGWEHYEVSNFCKPGNYSKHNTSYWQNKKYLGIGPSAHSFNGESRLWNVSNNATYLEKLDSGVATYEQENLSPQDRLNETLLTGLRTKWGVNLNALKTIFGYDINTLYVSTIHCTQHDCTGNP